MSISILEALNYGIYLFLSDIPSHNEIINLEKNNYIGEIFNELNFYDKKQKIEKNISKKNIKKIKKFKQKYFSDKSMAEGYIKVYEER